MRVPDLVIVLVAASAMACSTGSARDDNPAGGWTFAIGDAGEGLHTTSDRMPAAQATVSLPHRMLAPNTPLWYSRSVDLPRDAVLEVDADDGAQVFVDGIMLEHERRTFLLPRDISGARMVVIRVLNNAMEGGLRSVRVERETVGRAHSTPAPAQLPHTISPVESEAFRGRMPSGDRPCNFTLWADSQGGWPTFSRIVAMMTTTPSHFSAGVGDLVNDGSDAEAWSQFFRALEPLAAKTAIVPIAGNHDYDGYYNDLVPELYLRLFRAFPHGEPRRQSTWIPALAGPHGPEGSALDTSWFAWSCGPARFVAIDVNREFPVGISPGSAQHAWLTREIASREWTGARWRVLLVHQPPWSRSWKGYDGDDAVRRIVEPLARDHRLDLVVSGHSHAYERLARRVGERTVHALIVGGAGGGLEDAEAGALDGSGGDRIVVAHHFVRAHATPRELTLTAIGVDGTRFDSLTLRP